MNKKEKFQVKEVDLSYFTIMMKKLIKTIKYKKQKKFKMKIWDKLKETIKDNKIPFSTY